MKFFESITKPISRLFSRCLGNGLVDPLTIALQSRDDWSIIAVLPRYSSKKNIIISALTAVVMFFVVMKPATVGAEYSLVQLRIASVLINEMGGVAAITGEKNNEPMTRVAEVMRNMYNYWHKKNSRITYSDVLFVDTHFENARAKFAHLGKADLERMGRKAGSEWNVALNLAGKLVNGTLTSDIAHGANAFNANCEQKQGRAFANSLKYGDTPACLLKKVYGGKKQQYKVLAVQALPMQAKGMQTATFWQWELGGTRHAYDDDVTAPADPNFSLSESSNGTASEDSDGAREAASCAMDAMQAMYLTDESKVDQYCWYCKIVIVLVNAYLQAVSEALPATQSLGKVILKFGFLIWLAYYILQQVSSINAVTPGKMLQDILVMGFKVALAYSAVTIGAQIIRDYYLDPIVGTGIDYGWAIFTGGT